MAKSNITTYALLDFIWTAFCLLLESEQPTKQPQEPVQQTQTNKWQVGLSIATTRKDDAKEVT